MPCADVLPLRTALQGSAFYLGGSLLVIVGWTFVGLCVEAYGFFLLFCEFFPTALQFVRRIPMLGKVLDLPVVKMVSRPLLQADLLLLPSMWQL